MSNVARKLGKKTVRWIGAALIGVGLLFVVLAAFTEAAQMRNTLLLGLVVAGVGVAMGGWKVFRPKARVYTVTRKR